MKTKTSEKTSRDWFPDSKQIFERFDWFQFWMVDPNDCYISYSNKVTGTHRCNMSSWYEAEKILAMRQHKGKQREYLIKWKNYAVSDSTWEPQRSLNKPLYDSFHRPPSAEASHEVQAYIREVLSEELVKSLRRPLQSRITIPCHHRTAFDIFSIQPVPINTTVWLDRQHFIRAGFQNCIQRCINPLGRRRAIDFPVMFKASLRKSTKTWTHEGQVISGHHIPVISVQFTKSDV